MSEKNRNYLIMFLVLIGLSAAVLLRNFKESSTLKQFADDSVIGKGKPVLLELGSHQCKPCKAMIPILDQLNREYTSQFAVAFVDVWQNTQAGTKYGIDTIPTQLFFDAEGKELFRHTGIYEKEEIIAKWRQLGVQFP